MKKNSIKLIVSAIFIGLAFNVSSKENVGGTGVSTSPSTSQVKSVMSGCIPASQQIDLDINNVRAKILNGGDMWWDIFGTNNARYYVPKPAANLIGASSQFASSVWVGGYDAGGQLKEAAQTYRQSGNDYWPGPLKSDATTDVTRCLAWDKFYKINRDDVQAYYDWAVINGFVGPNPVSSTAMDVINNWPAFGPEGQPLAPFYSVTNDYTTYNPSNGDVPDFDVTHKRACTAQLYGDQSIFWVFNDKGNIHTETDGTAIGLEIQAQAFAFKANDEINNATFYKYKIINKSSFRLDSTFFGLWDDADLGWYLDDFVGCDVGLGLGILYNGTAVDGSGQVTAYGANPPAIGVDFFEGPKADANGKDDSASTVPASFLNYGNGIVDDERLGMGRFMYFNNNNNVVNGNPGAQQGGSSDDYYQYLSGAWKNGQQITYGGDGTNSGGTPCKYMFPGTSDPTYFGTNGVPEPNWDETSSHNSPGDRRFLESAGPFKLQPGAVNYITIGVPWARATQGGNLASVALVKGADAKAQDLFNNCFSKLSGPSAPLVTVQELNEQIVLYWTNPKGSNNYHEEYTEDYNKSSGADSLYRFQGYMIFQLKDATVSYSDIYNPFTGYNQDKARLVFECDKKDGISQIVNYNNDATISALIPTDMLDGALNPDQGIVHSISIKDDKFATGVTHLVNNKKYYYAIVSYGYSPTQNPINLNQINNYLPYIVGTAPSDLFVNTAIPHIPTAEGGGTVQQSTYGSGPQLKRIEGQGNGGNELELTASTIDEIMNSPSSRALNPVYLGGHGPAKIQVIDPLNVPANNDFRLTIYDDTTAAGLGVKSNSLWSLKNLTTGEVVNSDTTIRIANEQIINGQSSGNSFVIPKWGLSVIISFAYDPGYYKTITDPNSGKLSYIYPPNNCYLDPTNNNYTDVNFADPTKLWLLGVQDQEGVDERNWIRAGTFTNTADGAWNDYGTHLDDLQNFEKVAFGTWAPYCLCASTTPATGTNPITYVGGPALKDATVTAKNKIQNVASVDVVITSDKSKWSRCPVLEMGEYSSLAVGGTSKLMMRSSLSVDKNGLNATQSGYNPSEGDVSQPTGMSWFPGYAINIETGERLNMAFGEDSWLRGDNGADMIWNPTSNLFDFSNFITQADGSGQPTPIFGGKHYVYVFGHNGDQSFVNDAILGNSLKNIPRYDGGKVLHDLLAAAATPSASTTYREYAFSDAMWVGMPLLATGHSLLETDVTIKLRVSRSYQFGYTGSNISIYGKLVDTSVTPINRNLPVYEFNTSDIGTRLNNADAAASALDLINVVPNPYYAYSGYEQSTVENKVKITNLPEQCTVTIYTLNGTLVRTFKVDQPSTAKNTMGIAVTSLEWDLKNQARIPIASGLYIIHVEVPNVGEKTLKWFGVLRPIDLDSY